MERIHYIFNNAFLETDCPFGVVDDTEIVVKVASKYCQERCKFFKRDNSTFRYIECKNKMPEAVKQYLFSEPETNEHGLFEKELVNV